MTPKILKAVGLALYGERWMTSLARALGVEYSTVRRWHLGPKQSKRGGFRMSPETELKIAELCWNRMLKLDILRDAIKDQAATGENVGPSRLGENPERHSTP